MVCRKLLFHFSPFSFQYSHCIPPTLTVSPSLWIIGSFLTQGSTALYFLWVGHSSFSSLSNSLLLLQISDLRSPSFHPDYPVRSLPFPVPSAKQRKRNKGRKEGNKTEREREKERKKERAVTQGNWLKQEEGNELAHTTKLLIVLLVVDMMLGRCV